ncbi:unnamed protein product [Prunus brigantina]
MRDVGSFLFQQPDEWAWTAIRGQRAKSPKSLISYRGKISTIPILREKKKDEQKRGLGGLSKFQIDKACPSLMIFSIQGAWVRNLLWFQWFDAAGLSHRGESATCFPYGLFQDRAHRGKKIDEAFYPMDTSLTPMDFLWSCHGSLVTVVWSSNGNRT